MAAHNAQTATRHFEVGYGFSDRGGAVRRHLEDLWSPAGAVEVRRCAACGFGFAWPHVAGGAKFYNLVTGGTPAYPQDRWEFGRTLEALKLLRSEHPLRLVEAGAGDGAFLRQLRDEIEHVDALALEYDRAAAAVLRQGGFDVLEASIHDIADDADHQTSYDAVCMFQTLEHMDRPREVAFALSRLLKRGGSAFISVPNGAAIDAQERLTGFWDMPPNHVGRWTRQAFEKWLDDTPFVFVEDDLEPESDAARTATYANYRLLAERYSRWSLPSLAQHVRHPVAIELLTQRRRRRYQQRGWQLRDQLPPGTYWIHISKS